MRIAFVFGNTTAWTGGVNYYHNILTAIKQVRNPYKYHLLGLIPEGDVRFDDLLPCFDEECRIPPASFYEKVVKAASIVLSEKEVTRGFSPEPRLSINLRRINADVAFLKEDPLANFRIPSICWFPDFQYLHLPEMFSENERHIYSRTVRNTSNFGTRIILNSESAKTDYLSIFPSAEKKILVLPFVAWINDDVYEDEPGKIAREYNLPENFFYLPNQLWKHKNHMVVLEALTQLKDVAPSITVVASGAMDDYRNPSYPSTFVAEIERRNLRRQFLLLGMIPRRHVYSLLRQSIALIQPSLFEGWSTSIEEAKSLGKLVIASNLEVHREQNAPGALYFDPDDGVRLAKYLIQCDQEVKPGVNKQVESQARESMHARARFFGERFLTTVDELIN